MPELRKVEPVKEKSEGRVKIKADKIEIEVESNTKGTMFCLVIAEKILKGFKEKDGKMFYKSEFLR